ncbi:MAG: class I SAM-dependent methyltransferase [Gemmataceae bacterium]
MSAGNNGTEMLSAAEQLASALRSGLELRWSIPRSPSRDALSFPPRGSVRPFLEPLADSLRFRLPHTGHPLHRFLRALRYLARKLIGPWLDFQSHFNLAAISVVDQVEQRVRALEDAELALRQNLETLEKILVSRADRALGEQINTLEDLVRRRVNQELSRQGKIGQAGMCFDAPVQVQIDQDGPRIAEVSARILEQIFVHTHLPCPPARLLALGCSHCTNAIEMASLGFQVVGIDGRPYPLSHPNFTMIQSHRAELPFEDESFDGSVALSSLGRFGGEGLTQEGRAACEEQAIGEVFRVLKRGGLFLLTVPFGHRTTASGQHFYSRARLDRLLHAYRVVERGYGVRDGDSWTFTLDEKRAEFADNSDRISAICLLVLEKP